MKESDLKELARLVHEYGVETICQVAAIALEAIDDPEIVDHPKKGRRSTEMEDAIFAEFIDNRASEYRQKGSKKPIDDAYFDVYNIEFPKSQQEGSNHYSTWKRGAEERVYRGRTRRTRTK